MQVTALKRVSSDRYDLEFEDGSTVSTVLSVVADHSLYTGRSLTDEEYKAVLAASALGRCKARALRVISARAMSEKELTDRLRQKGESEENAAASAAWLTDLGLLKDEDYARSIGAHYAAKGYGPGRVREELYRRGLSRELRDQVMEEAVEDEAAIDALLRKKLRGDENPDRETLKKAGDFLLRRGFSREAVYSALRRIKSEIEEE